MSSIVSHLSQSVAFIGILSALATIPSHAQQNPPASADSTREASAKEPPPKLRSAMPRMPCERPDWPREALRRELEGTVTMKFLIDADGHVLEKAISKSSGHEILDIAALEATARCTLVVKPEDGPAQQEWVHLRYVWTLQ
ncbi:energy transducer TonB [Massilia sp. YIM B04103]|uniref:energy transducer TonB n=1 Tax=Massilia sp. YIM B04103 TaxID=2963106 RepID=UPI00210B2F9F|nr:energy transducer TonB [Massilia sp. YIM B04103]